MVTPMFRWARGRVRLFVPPGQQLFAEVRFDAAKENEIRIYAESERRGEPVKIFDSRSGGGGTWESPPNQATHTLVFELIPRFREAPDRPWQHFIEDRGDVLYADDRNAVLGFEDGRDAEFNDTRLSLHWRALAEEP